MVDRPRLNEDTVDVLRQEALRSQEMQDLNQMTCEPCQVGAATLSDSEIHALLPQVPEWAVTEQQGVKRLERAFKFKNFAAALEFTRHVGELAEANAHHPRIVTEWGSTKVIWWTHKIKGLHRNDFIMASKTDELMT